MSELDAGGDSQFAEDAADLIGDRVNRGASLLSNLLVAGTTQNGQRYGSLGLRQLLGYVPRWDGNRQNEVLILGQDNCFRAHSLG